MRIVQLNLAADWSLQTPAALLDRYHTLRGWSSALSAAGAHVSVVQRFREPAAVERDGISYTFVADDAPGLLPQWEVSAPALDATAGFAPDLVHVNGLMFPAMSLALRERLGDTCALVAQDHSGAGPSASLVTRLWSRQRWQRAFAALDACSFTARELARPWRDAGLPDACPILEIPEASTSFAPLPREDARAQTGIHGAPAILWVGRAHAAKDPTTMAAAVERVLSALTDAHVWVLVSKAEDQPSLQRLLASSSTVSSRVHISGPVPHARMPAYYSAADILLGTSRHEGSGYAVIEAMACGAIPCVSDIPSFRTLAGSCGVLWPVGDAASCAAALVEAAHRVGAEQRRTVRQHFVDRVSWPVIGRITFDAYTTVVNRRRGRS